MAEGSAANRWWENYLVRYFLPSIIGMLIVAWLQENTGANRYIHPLFVDSWSDFNMPQLVLWLLVGSLYCYLASYPALVFHATRMLDFRDVYGRMKTGYWLLINPYVVSVLFTVLAWGSSRCKSAYVSLVVVCGFAIAQGLRIWLVSSRYGEFGLTRTVDGRAKASFAYAYLRVLAERRGIVNSKERNKTTNKAMVVEKEIVESYRHLREHGNTALIVLLELALCPILSVVLGTHFVPQNQRSTHDASTDIFLSIVLLLWVLPSVFIHGFAQHLEHRFSWFRYSLEDGEGISPIEEDARHE